MAGSQGCQMVLSKPKIPIWVNFVGWYFCGHLVWYFCGHLVWYFCGHLVFLWSFGMVFLWSFGMFVVIWYFCGHLVFLWSFVIWDFVPRKLWQPCCKHCSSLGSFQMPNDLTPDDKEAKERMDYVRCWFSEQQKLKKTGFPVALCSSGLPDFS
jgi:hypothetical protein